MFDPDFHFDVVAVPHGPLKITLGMYDGNCRQIGGEETGKVLAQACHERFVRIVRVAKQLGEKDHAGVVDGRHAKMKTVGKRIHSTRRPGPFPS